MLLTQHPHLYHSSKHSTRQKTSSKSSKPSSNGAIIVEEKVYLRNKLGEKESYTIQYQRGKLLGKGGFAKCYEFTNLHTGQIYAAKVIDKSTLVKSKTRQKLSSEIKIHSSMNHKHIVKFEKYFEDSKNVYILLEICRCRTLMELLRKRKRITENEAKYFIRQILSALEYMHGKMVIHRDLKLGNLFLSENMDIKIGDFGLAAQLDYEGQRKRTICGTPNYIAPEVLGSEKGHSYEVDIWSIGVILYTLIIGTPPFETSNVNTTYKKIRANIYSFPSHIPISIEAKNLIKKILNVNPQARPTVAEILRDPFMAKTPLTCPIELMEYAYSCTRHARLPLKAINHNIMKDEQKNTESTQKAFQSTQKPFQQSTQKPFQQPIQKTIQHTTQQPFQQTIQSTTQQLTQQMTQQSTQSTQPHHIFQKPFQQAFQQPLPFSLPTKQESPKDRKISPTIPTRDPIHVLSREPSRSSNDRTNNNDAVPLSDRPKDQFKDPLIKDQFNNRQLCEKQQPKDEKDDECNLTNMHDNIEKSFAGIKSLPIDEGLSKPTVWVSQWADFSNKYGLAYKLNNGLVGAHYNDSTKLVWNTKTGNIEYMERKRTPQGAYDEKNNYRMDNFPESMNKKITLIKYFRSYLEKHASKPTNGELEKDCDYVYVKRWLKTRHAVIFRLSNKTVQVCFFDNTEIILSSEARLVTYTNHSGETRTFSLSSIVNNPQPDVGKRLKYTKDILYQLINRNK